MSAIELRRLLRRSRRSLALAAAVLAMLGLVELHHGIPMGMHAMPDAAVCMAVLGVGVAAAVAVASLFVPRRGLPVDWLVPAGWLGEPRSIPARAGPLYLRLAVLRR